MNKTLAEAKKGDILKITGCIDLCTSSQIMRFGLAEGEIIKCIAKVGPVIVGKNRQRIAIGRKLADKIFIQTQAA